MAQIEIVEDAPRKWTKAEIYSWDWKPVFAPSTSTSLASATTTSTFTASTVYVHHLRIHVLPREMRLRFLLRLKTQRVGIEARAHRHHHWTLAPSLNPNPPIRSPCPHTQPPAPCARRRRGPPAGRRRAVSSPPSALCGKDGAVVDNSANVGVVVGLLQVDDEAGRAAVGVRGAEHRAGTQHRLGFSPRDSPSAAASETVGAGELKPCRVLGGLLCRLCVPGFASFNTHRALSTLRIHPPPDTHLPPRLRRSTHCVRSASKCKVDPAHRLPHTRLPCTTDAPLCDRTLLSKW
ncbi:hypothetical protein C8J57DRAFT_1719549 [Mycena rebaudengoi]|nr:hypothetical protein C8J57DRAFT_1719549 [Mycena rebaudengoi]